MPDWPRSFGGVQYFESVGQVSSNGTGLTAPASANTKGAWQQITAATDKDWDGFHVQVLVGQGTLDVLIDIGIGAAASEQVILENVLISSPNVGAGDGYTAAHFYVPLPVKAGTRVAGRYQTSSTTNDEVFVLLEGAAGDSFSALSLGRATTYGASTADSGGTSVDCGGSINTKGAWSQLSAAIANPIRHALVCFGNQANNARTNVSFLVDVGVGAAAAEVVVVPNMYVRARQFDDLLVPPFAERSMTAQSGQRLAARAQCQTADATDRLVDVVVIGFD